MRTLCWLGCVVTLIGCAASRKGDDGAAGSGVERRPVAGAGLDDTCQAHRDQVLSYLEMNRSCFYDFECQLVGSCSAGFGFEAVNFKAIEGAQALSDKTPEG